MKTNNMAPKVSPVKTSKWTQLVDSAKPSLSPPQCGGFISDAQLKKLIREHIGAKSCPSAIERPSLVDTALKLNLITSEQARIPAPPKKKAAKSWHRLVEEALPRESPIEGGWISNAELKLLIETHIGGGEFMTDNAGRNALIQTALKLNIISEERSLLPAAVYLDEAELKTRIKQHYDATPGPSKRPPLPTTRAKLIEKCVALGLISNEEAEAKHTRPDRAHDAEVKKETQEVVRSAGVKAILRGLPGAERIKDNILVVSELMSRLAYERGFLVWLHIHRLVTEGKELPDLKKEGLNTFVRHCYTVGTNGGTTKNDEIMATLKKYNDIFPLNTMALPEFRNVVTHAANVYAGAFKKHFTDMETVKQRIRRYASAELFDLYVRQPVGEDDVELAHIPTKPDVGDNPLYNIISALEDKTFDISQLHPKQRAVIVKLKATFGLPDGVNMTKNWLKNNIHGSIRFTLLAARKLDDLKAAAAELYEIVNKMEESVRPKLRSGAAKGIRFLPLNKLSRKFITLDATDLIDILEIPHLKGDNVRDVLRAALAANIKRELGTTYAQDPKILHPNMYYFDGTVDTDGETMHLHFRRGLRPEEKYDASRSKAKQTRLATVPRVVLAVDPGRVSMITMVLLVDGKPVRKERTTAKGKVVKHPVKFVLTARQYYSMSGMTQAKIIRARRDCVRKNKKAKSVGAKNTVPAMDPEFTLMTGDHTKILAYLKASKERADDMGAASRWVRALHRRAAAQRRRRSMGKKRALSKWFAYVHKRVVSETREPNATVVWGDAGVASTGKGNLSVPTGFLVDVARQVPGWTVVKGSEFRSSQRSCVDHDVVLCAARFIKSSVTVEIAKPIGFRQRVRAGFVIGLNARRIMRRSNRFNNRGNRQVEHKEIKRLAKVKKKIEMTFDGHSGESAETKKTKRERRMQQNQSAVYVRGLRVYQNGNTTEFFDRDVNACYNIGTIWIADNVEGFTMPAAFVRSTKKTTRV